MVSSLLTRWLGCRGAGPVRILGRDEWPVDIDEAISIILGLLLSGGQLVFVEGDVLHRRRWLGHKHIQLPFVLLIQLEHLLQAVHYLRQVPARVYLWLQRLVLFKRQLIVNVRLSMVDQLELYALHGLDRINVDDAYTSATVRTRDLKEKLSSLIFVPQEIELPKTYNITLRYRQAGDHVLWNLQSSCMWSGLFIARLGIFRRRSARLGSDSWSCWPSRTGASFTRLFLSPSSTSASLHRLFRRSPPDAVLYPSKATLWSSWGPRWPCRALPSQLPSLPSPRPVSQSTG